MAKQSTESDIRRLGLVAAIQPDGSIKASYRGPVAGASAADIGRTMLALFDRERALMEEGAANYAAMQAGSPPTRPISDHERRVTAHIQLLMNGSTPPELLMPAVSRDDQIRAELDAISYVRRQLSRQQELALYSEAEQWANENAAEWRELCRQIILAAERLAALEERARKFLLPIEGSCIKIAMGPTIGSGLSLLGVGDPLAEMRTDALKEKIVTEAEIRKAQNAD
jgi:hypothetical protein